MLKLTDPLLTRAESKAISVFRFRMPAGILRYSVRIITIPGGLTVMAEPLGVGVEKPDLKERRIMLDIRTNYRHQN